MLSPTAQEVYEITDPSTIPALKIHGDGEWESYPDPYVATVWFDTDQGRFGVDVSRTALDAPWVGERIIFPGEGSILQ
ncbi:hypothetical protein EHW97_14855 [Aeromicrobium camelliae]|uniref:Uncharacterized protein n=1 Tax=Aeromicrobium camelliae TaxID=1538144 RepID=A0A3N6WAE7_9ACTN|nr:hypothetical protein [Aeromicrobium camelliae]RQN02032.1 hypothetical protein EHW97_14855 [Aeromicrobium camelliae]